MNVIVVEKARMPKQDLENRMNNLKSSFEDVADWCERHLEKHQGRESGMTFGALLRTYGRLATLPLHAEQKAAKERELNAKAEEFLRQLSSRFRMSYDSPEHCIKVVDPMSKLANMTFDPGPPPIE